MKEKDVIGTTRSPITINQIIEDAGHLGISGSDMLLVHSSLSSIGWVCGGPQAVVQALLTAVGEGGTLVMPAQSSDWSDPAEWENPPVPETWRKAIYEEWPAFDPAITPTRGMGRIAELFRTFPGTYRSNHPQVSFCANGAFAASIVADHPLTPQFGPDSPLGKLYAWPSKAKVLLLGVGYDSCTSFHLAETLLEGMPRKSMGAPIAVKGERVWQQFEDYDYDSGNFAEIGRRFDEQGEVRTGYIGRAYCRLFGMREAVDYAGRWLMENRKV
ncbi:AAC(3) family N-acetyltransferase [Paenibacillus sp. GYB004]|uniref:aminoglycoside N(3)-acetyltransferase n=1 Tax=Paenibacillus sp. GYB004 TaxID=2994393 RepID=UPI002F965902